MTLEGDRLVADYLAEVERATAGLAPDRRAELLHDLSEHIDTERAELTTETGAGIRTILDRLGDPYTIAVAADAAQTGPRLGMPEPPLEPPAAPQPDRRGLIIVGAIVVAVIVIVGLLACAGTLLATQGRQQGSSAPSSTFMS